MDPLTDHRSSVNERLAHLSPEKRELLLRKLAAAKAPSAIKHQARAGQAQPLSAAQQRMWFFERLQPGSSSYHVYAYYDMRGPLDRDALQQAFSALIHRHDALRTRFMEVDGQPRQVADADAQLKVELIDVSAQPLESRNAEAQRLASAEFARPFDLTRAPLLRAKLLRLEPNQHQLLITIHHIISDEWSVGILMRELAHYYNATRANSDANLPPLPLQFADAVLWQIEPEQLRREETQLTYWQDAIQGASGLLDLPTDHPRTGSSLGRGGRLQLDLPQSLTLAVEALARHSNATVFMVYLAAFQALLSRLSGQDDIVVGTPITNRRRAEFEPLIGLFINTVPLRGEFDDEPSFRQFLERTRARCLDAFDNTDVALERIVDKLSIERAPGRTPLFQAMFVLQSPGDDAPEFDGIHTGWITPSSGPARLELTFALAHTLDGLGGVIDYDADLFEPATIKRLAEQYRQMLRAATEDPDRTISRINLLSDTDRRELLQLGDGGPATAPQTLFELFLAQAARSPQVTALASPAGELNYGDLLRRSACLAQVLGTHSVGPESRVALLADRSAESIVAVLGILAAGAAYVPLDPAQPDARLHLLLEDSSALVLVAPPTLLARAQALGSSVPVLSSEQTGDGVLPSVDRRPEHAAYVIYTSGSTGRPKGVVIENRGASNLVHGFVARHEFCEQRLLMIPPLIFDASVGDVFPVLASGSALVLHPAPAELGTAELEQFCREYAVTAIDAPAAMWRRWVEGWNASTDGTPMLPGLRLMMIGGESVPVELVRRFASATNSQVTLCNHYGPTEASVCATMLATRDARELSGAELPIGTPLPGVQVHVLDRHLQLTPRGAVGELCIGGAGIAREYLGLPELTRNAFIPDPLRNDASASARLYRTGDLARWTHDGHLQFLGRRDHQVKLRGVRIELGEIERTAEAHPRVQGAVALIREDRPGDRRLALYFVSSDALSPEDARAYMGQQLPAAMLPSTYMRLQSLPLTRNGKVDRRALPAPADSDDHHRERLAPGTETERKVLEVWREILGREDIGADEDFFALGGDSLMTLPLVFRLHAVLEVQVPLPTVFAAPTVQQLARAIDQLRDGGTLAVVDLDSQVVLPAEIDARNAHPAATLRSSPRAALVTGATGFLGAYLVRELLDTTDAEVVCLVRAPTPDAGLCRVRGNLERYNLWRDGDQRRLTMATGDLAAPLLGLGEDAFAALASSLDVIFHNGGQVNFLVPYEQLEAANVGGTREVLRLATQSVIKPVHLVSTLGVYASGRLLGTTVRESDSAPTSADQFGGYNQSKWVGEQLALLARERGLPVAIYRPARITGDSKSGVGNADDYFSSWIKGCIQLGIAPHTPDESFDMAPVNYVGPAIVRLALGAGDANGNFHFFNPEKLPSSAALAEMRAAGYKVDEVPYSQWRQALLATVSDARENPLSRFAGIFPEDYDPSEPKFDCSATANAVAATGLHCPPADRALFARYLHWMHEQDQLTIMAETDA